MLRVPFMEPAMKQKEKEKKVSFAELANGVEHIRGNLYRIKRDNISFAESGFDLESNELKFSNPRYYRRGDKLIAKGLLHDNDAMDSLRKSITIQGLLNPPLLRCVEANDEIDFQIVDGERRMRSLFKLCDENVKVYNSETAEFDYAGEVYDWIVCRIERLNDKEAIARAVSLNEDAVSIGEAANADLVKYLRNCGCGDNEICQITGRGEGWLRETDRLIELDEETFTALAQDKINRRIALKLAELSVEERAERLDQLLIAAQERIEKVQVKLAQDEDKAKMNAELAKAKIAVVKHRGGDLEEAQEEHADAEAKVAKIRTKRKDIEEEGAKATIKDWNGVKPLTLAKIKKHWTDTIDNLLENEDDDEGKINLDDARLMKLACDAIEAGEIDVLKILRQHEKNK
jgi:hypothetical protein